MTALVRIVAKHGMDWIVLEICAPIVKLYNKSICWFWKIYCDSKFMYLTFGIYGKKKKKKAYHIMSHG